MSRVPTQVEAVGFAGDAALRSIHAECNARARCRRGSAYRAASTPPGPANTRHDRAFVWQNALTKTAHERGRPAGWADPPAPTAVGRVVGHIDATPGAKLLCRSAGIGCGIAARIGSCIGPSVGARIGQRRPIIGRGRVALAVGCAGLVRRVQRGEKHILEARLFNVGRCIGARDPPVGRRVARFGRGRARNESESERGESSEHRSPTLPPRRGRAARLVTAHNARALKGRASSSARGATVADVASCGRW